MKLVKNGKTISELQVILTVLFTSALLISNVITSKQCLFPFGITMTGAIFIFPVTYILSDVFSECYGYRWSRITCYLAFSMNVIMVIFFTMAIYWKSPAYWENQEAFKTVLGSTPRVLAASLTAYVVGDLVNDRVFRKMKAKHPDMKGFGVRAIVSSLLGELVDSVIFLPLAFLGKMPVSTLLTMVVVQVFLKTLYEVLILPITIRVARSVNKYESSKILN